MTVQGGMAWSVPIQVEDGHDYDVSLHIVDEAGNTNFASSPGAPSFGGMSVDAGATVAILEAECSLGPIDASGALRTATCDDATLEVSDVSFSISRTTHGGVVSLAGSTSLQAAMLASDGGATLAAYPEDAPVHTFTVQPSVDESSLPVSLQLPSQEESLGVLEFKVPASWSAAVLSMAAQQVELIPAPCDDLQAAGICLLDSVQRPYAIHFGTALTMSEAAELPPFGAPMTLLVDWLPLDPDNSVSGGFRVDELSATAVDDLGPRVHERASERALVAIEDGDNSRESYFEAVQALEDPVVVTGILLEEAALAGGFDEWLADILALADPAAHLQFLVPRWAVMQTANQGEYACNEWQPNRYRWEVKERLGIHPQSVQHSDDWHQYAFYWGFKWNQARFNNSVYKDNDDSGFEWSANFRFNDEDVDALCMTRGGYTDPFIGNPLARVCRPRLVDFGAVNFPVGTTYYQDNYDGDRVVKVGLGNHAMDRIKPGEWYDAWAWVEHPFDYSEGSRFWPQFLLFVAVDANMSCPIGCDDNWFFKDAHDVLQDGQDFPFDHWDEYGLINTC